MGKFYLINAPWGFSTVWSLVKGWLDEATVAKIHILSSDYKKALLEQIPADSLPAFLGGTCACPEGCSMSDAGPWKGKKAASVQGAAQAQVEVSSEAGEKAVEGVKGVNGAVVAA